MTKKYICTETTCFKCKGKGGETIWSHDCWGKMESDYQRCDCCSGIGTILTKIKEQPKRKKKDTSFFGENI